MMRGGVLPVLGVMAAVATASPAHAGGCMRPVKVLPAGAIVTAGDFEPAPCAKPEPAFRYDPRVKAVRTTRELKAAEAVERLPVSLLPAVRPGQHLVVNAAVGPVIVQRDVEALQAAGPGERLFVRAADGAVFAVQLPEAKP